MNQVDAPNVAAEPTPFIDNPRLWECLPSQTNRYDDVFAGPRAARTMAPGSQSALMNVDPDSRPQLIAVPEGWIEYIHPVEGRPYYYNSELRVITETYLRHPNQLTYIEEWYAVFRELRNRVLPSATDLDVFLDCDGRNTCRYYMIDHANRTICWLRQRQTSGIGIADVCSVLGLRALLSEEYWTHLEYVPKKENHLGAARSELQGALASCLLDHMTSEGSTSPFTKTECESYLHSLNQMAESGDMIGLNWSIARIMGLLVHSRNVNRYGRYGGRLDRTATLEGRRHLPRFEGFMCKSILVGGGPGIRSNRLENLWADRVIGAHHRRRLTNNPVGEWSTAAAGDGVMWESNMVFVASPSVDIITKTICGISSKAAGGTGVFTLHMIREHLSLGKYAAHAANYFQLYESHATGLQGLSIKYSENFGAARCELQGPEGASMPPDISQSSGKSGSIGRVVKRVVQKGQEFVVKAAASGARALPGVACLVEACKGPLMQQSIFEYQEVHVCHYLESLSNTVQSCVDTLCGMGGTNTQPNNIPELRSFIDSLGTVLHERRATSVPFSRLLDAEERQRQLEEAIDLSRNQINQFVVNLLMKHELRNFEYEQRIQELHERVRVLEERSRAVLH